MKRQSVGGPLKKPWYAVIGFAAVLVIWWVASEIAENRRRSDEYREALEAALHAPNEPESSPELQPEPSDSSNLFSESDRWIKDYDKLTLARDAEKKGVNWRVIPDDEKNLRLTTGKAVFKGVDNRLVVGNFPDGSPRFIIQQATPDSIGFSSRKPWINQGVHYGWMADGRSVTFFTDDTLLEGSWVVRDRNGDPVVEINLKRTGEMEGIDFFDETGNRKGGVFWLNGKWAGSTDDPRVRQAEDVIKAVRGYASQVPE